MDIAGHVLSKIKHMVSVELLFFMFNVIRYRNFKRSRPAENAREPDEKDGPFLYSTRAQVKGMILGLPSARYQHRTYNPFFYHWNNFMTNKANKVNKK